MSKPVAGGGGGAGRIGTLTDVDMGLPLLETPLTVRLKDVPVSPAATEITALRPSAAGVMVTLASSAVQAGTLPGCSAPGSPGPAMGAAVKWPEPPTGIPLMDT